jgi:3-oxoacyl-[acyl-carrier-protein] synthase II
MAREVWITGIGLTSSLGEGLDAHWKALAETEHPQPVIDRLSTPPFPFHPMVPLNLDLQIPRRADQRQMEPWQRLGTYTAGLALADAGIAGNLDILGRTHMIVAAGGGERDIAADNAILEGLRQAADPDDFLNERLGNDLRPTLFLAQLPNLMAGNISIVHKVTGSSRTFMGEEIAGVSAIEIAWRRIRGDQGDIFLAGGGWIAGRKDVVLYSALGGKLWAGEPISVWGRPERGGGAIMGSIACFLVLESREHAEARGRKPYARLASVLSDQSRRRPGEAAAKATRRFEEIAPMLGKRPASVLSGATGVREPTREEQEFLAGLIAEGRIASVRGSANVIGSGVEATFPALTGLAALALSRRGFYRPADETGFEREAEAPDRVLVTSWGIWRGEGMGLVEAID